MYKTSCTPDVCQLPLTTVIAKFPIDSIRSTLPHHSPGYSQLALIYSSTENCSFVLCQLIIALDKNNVVKCSHFGW